MAWRRVLLMVLLAMTSLAHASPRERMSLHQGWLFHKGGVVDEGQNPDKAAAAPRTSRLRRS